MTIKVIKPADLLPDKILGVIQHDWNEKQEHDYLKKIEKYYGFKCAIYSNGQG